MDLLDTREGQTVYILRETFDRSAKIAMPWMAEKAFFDHVPFPVTHIDTEKNFSEMHVYRECCAQDWALDLLVGTCPPVERMDHEAEDVFDRLRADGYM